MRGTATQAQWLLSRSCAAHCQKPCPVAIFSAPKLPRGLCSPGEGPLVLLGPPTAGDTKERALFRETAEKRVGDTARMHVHVNEGRAQDHPPSDCPAIQIESLRTLHPCRTKGFPPKHRAQKHVRTARSDSHSWLTVVARGRRAFKKQKL